MAFCLNSRLLLRAWSWTPLSLLACTLSLSTGHASAADAPLMQGAGTIITTTDVRLEMQRLPPESQAQLLDDPALLRQLIDNAYLRRALAAQAERQGLLQDPVLQHLLLSTRENLLAEAELQRLAQAARPDSTALEKLAQSAYKAESERFQTPARTRARHILVKGKDAAAHAQADKLLAQLRAGGDFEALAREHSADPRSAAQGGDLGFFPKGQMVASFDAALEKLKNPGDLSGVVASQFGFHMIRLEERQPASSQSYDEVREQLRAEITAKLQKNARTQALERLRTQAEGDADQLQSFIATQKQEQPAASAADAAAVQPAAPKAAP